MHGRIFALIGMLLAAAAPLSSDAAVGRTAGAASVSPNGAGRYAIPLTLPQGTAGLQPGLSLVYDHRAGDGLLGMGFQISGLSSIHRCNKTRAQDGIASVATLSASDGYCLDGNRLRLTGGSYGAADSTYQTEIETFSRVTAKGTAGNGPQWWEVRGKDGLIYEYGNTTDSRIEPLAIGGGQVASARTWAISRIRDRSGNTIEFEYIEDVGNGSHRPSAIRWTGNPDQGISAPYAVSFIYEGTNRPDPLHSYAFGNPLTIDGRVSQLMRMDRIDVLHGSTVVRRYELSYQAAGGAGARSRLESLQECGLGGSDCFAPTTFTWVDGVAGWNGEANSAQAVPTTPMMMDINGDGLDDVVYSSNTTSGSGHWYYMLASASGGYGSAVSTGIANTNYAAALPIEWDGDGRRDLLVPYSDGTWWVLPANGSGFGAPVNTGIGWDSVTQWWVADVDGDGRGDLIRTEDLGYAANLRVRHRTDSGFATTEALLASFAFHTNNSFVPNAFGALSQRFRSSHRAPDFDGDGREDLVVIFQGYTSDPEFPMSGVFRAIVYGGGGVYADEFDPTAPPTGWVTGDFNGDGLTDLASSREGTLRYVLSRGRGFSTGGVITSLASYGANTFTAADWDADGMDDIVLSHASAGTLHVARSTGIGFSSLVNTGAPGPANSIYAVGDVNGDGLHDIARVDVSSSNHWKHRLHSGSRPDLLSGVTDGFGIYAGFNYVPITQNNYSKHAGAVFPEVDYQGPLYVVSSLTASDGIGGTYDTSFWYYGARMHLHGRGFEGFSARRMRDSRNGLWHYAWFKQQFPYTGALSEATTYQPDETTIISHVEQQWAHHAYPSDSPTRYFPFVTQTTSSHQEVGGSHNGDLVRSVTQQRLVDYGTGTPYDVTTTVTEAASANGVQPGATYVQRVYSPPADFAAGSASWCIGRPGQTQFINSHSQFQGNQVIRTMGLTWDTEACRPTQQVMEPGNGQLQITRDFVYDGFGNVQSDSVTGAQMAQRTTQTGWGTDGRFPRTVTNALSQTATLGWDEVLGVRTSLTDPNGIQVAWHYDEFARPEREDRADGTATTLSYVDCASLGCLNGNNKVVVVANELSSAGATVTDSRTYLDRFNRPLATSTRMLSGEYNRQERQYDAFGRIAQQGMPCVWTSCSAFWVSYDYDLLGRPVQATRPASEANPALQTTTTYYEGLTTRVVDPQGKQTKHISNVLGQLARSVDHDQHYQDFDYDAFGNTVRITDNELNTLLSATFNLAGVRTAATYMGAGSWTYTPNALGEIVAQTDANGQVTTFAYDNLGRLISRIDPGAAPAGQRTTTFTFGTSQASRNIGKLESVYGPGGVGEQYLYDALGRLQRVRYDLAGDGLHDIDYAYNNAGLLDTLTYPTSTAGYRLKLQYGYSYGRLQQISDFNAPSSVFWTAVASNASGQITQEALGNGLVTSMGFDAVTGLPSYIRSGPGGGVGVQNLSYLWDAVGNLVQRQDGNQGLTEDFYYDNLYRLDYSLLNGSMNLDVAYDARGNITSKFDAIVTPPQASTITWYPYNLPETVTVQAAQGSGSSQFFYDPFRSRYKQVATSAGATQTTLYIGGLIEQVNSPSGSEYRHYVPLPTGTTALHTRNSTGSNSTHYLLADHLGSTDRITNASGGVLAALSYNAFGKRRGDAWTGTPSGSDWNAINTTTPRGFTGHEHLDDIGLTHMNGRVYDPATATFLSPDPFVQAPGFTQSFNRFAYTVNNPLSYTDPSGFTYGGLDEIKAHDCQTCSVLNGFAAQGTEIDLAGSGSGSGLWTFLEHGTIEGNHYGNRVSGLNGPTGNVADWLWTSGSLVRGAPYGSDYSRREDVRGGTPGGQDGGSQVGLPEIERGSSQAAATGASSVHGPSTVGGTGWGQTIINSTVPGAYYAGQAELAFREGHYGLGVAHSVASLLEAGVGVFTLGRSTATLGAVRAIGFAPGTAEAAFSAMRGGGGHAIRHLQGNLIPNTGSLASRVDAFKALAVPILENPVHTADWRIGATLGRAFLGKVNGTDLVIVVAKEGPYQGQVISSFVPDANQLSLILAR